MHYMEKQYSWCGGRCSLQMRRAIDRQDSPERSSNSPVNYRVIYKINIKRNFQCRCSNGQIRKGKMKGRRQNENEWNSNRVK